MYPPPLGGRFIIHMPEKVCRTMCCVQRRDIDEGIVVAYEDSVEVEAVAYVAAHRERLLSQAFKRVGAVKVKHVAHKLIWLTWTTNHIYDVPGFPAPGLPDSVCPLSERGACYHGDQKRARPIGANGAGRQAAVSAAKCSSFRPPSTWCHADTAVAVRHRSRSWEIPLASGAHRFPKGKLVQLLMAAAAYLTRGALACDKVAVRKVRFPAAICLPSSSSVDI